MHFAVVIYFEEWNLREIDGLSSYLRLTDMLVKTTLTTVLMKCSHQVVTSPSYKKLDQCRSTAIYDQFNKLK
jgi:hypothetical protein